MNRREFLFKLEMLTGSDPGSLTGEELLSDVPHWDSMQALEFVVLVSKELDVIVDGERVQGAKTIDDLVGLVQDHLTDQ